MIVDVTFDISSEIEAGLRAGDLFRHGGVVRDSAGRLVNHLREVSPSRQVEDAVDAAVLMHRKPIVFAGLVLAGVATVTTIVRMHRLKRGPEEAVRTGADYVAPTCPTCTTAKSETLESLVNRSRLTVVPA